MVEIKQISKEELPQLVYLSYEGDTELCEKYHFEKYTLSEAVQATLDAVDTVEKQVDKLEYYNVLFNEKSMGYFIKWNNFLYSFCVGMRYRTKEILTEWWDKVGEVMGEKFTTGLLTNNTRAIEYMIKRGMRVTWENPERNKNNEILLST